MIPVKLFREDAKKPTRSHASDAGLDLYCCEDFVLYSAIPGIELSSGLQEPDTIREWMKTVGTGIAMQIPEGYFGSIRGRSGLGAKGIVIADGPMLEEGILITGGVVDSGYRGEIKVTLINLGKEVMRFKAGDRIAQIIIQEKRDDECEIVEELEDSERGEKGFSSSGT